MKRVQQELGDTFCKSTWFLHPISRCDTTSRPYGIGKAAPVKNFSDSSHLKEQANVYNVTDSPADDLVREGVNTLVVLYGVKLGKSLDSLRRHRYHQKVCTRSREVKPQNPSVSNIRCSKVTQYGSLPSGETVADPI